MRLSVIRATAVMSAAIVVQMMQGPVFALAVRMPDMQSRQVFDNKLRMLAIVCSIDALGLGNLLRNDFRRWFELPALELLSHCRLPCCECSGQDREARA